MSLKTLLHLWLRKVWQGYDSGGVSAGRSIRCNMVDVWLDIYNIDHLRSRSADDYPYQGILEAITGFPVIEDTDRRQLLLTDLPKYKKDDIAHAAMGVLIAWHFRLTDDEAWRSGVELKRKILKEMLSRIPYFLVSDEIDLTTTGHALQRLVRNYLDRYDSERRQLLRELRPST